jgi:hypothetical protein
LIHQGCVMYCLKCRNLNLGLARVHAKRKGQESCLMLSWVQESVREGTLTLPSELPLWKLESWWTPKFSKRNFKGQNLMDWNVPYTIAKLLELRCLKWLAWSIWTFETQVMAKWRVESQIANLTPDH